MTPTDIIGDDVRLYRGDCLDVLPMLAPKSVDAVITDLPYGMTDCPWDSQLDLKALWFSWKHCLTANGVIILTASQPFTSVLVSSNYAAFRHEWIWEKNAGSNFGTVKRQPMKEHESVLVFSWGKYHYEPIMQERAESGLSRVRSGVVNYATKAEAYSSGGLTGTASSNRPDLRYPRSIQRFNRERGLHPTQKPTPLMAYFIRSFTTPGETVLDCCMGSGTTLVAARDEGRKAIGIELDPTHYATALRRLTHATGAGPGQLFGALEGAAS